LRTLMLSGILALLLLAGCAALPLQPETGEPVLKVCRNVSEQKPVIIEKCGEVSTTEQVCGARKLPYDATRLPRIDLCIMDGPCVGRPLSECDSCTNAMTRCTLVIENEDAQKAGTWTVAANYTFGNFGFNKDPITAVIKPNETFAFDFQQIYAPGHPVTSAICNISVVAEAVVDDCHEETRTKTECKNVTANATILTEVCE